MGEGLGFRVSSVVWEFGILGIEDTSSDGGLICASLYLSTYLLTYRSIQPCARIRACLSCCLACLYSLSRHQTHVVPWLNVIIAWAVAEF